jgi:signal transduction histidine kinase
MHSARTEAAPSRWAAATGVLQRLNVRLVLVVLTVALLALLVSGVALSQILPRYFVDQATRRAETAEISTAILAQNQFELYAQLNPSWLSERELRNTEILRKVAEIGANTLAQGTVEITYTEDGSLAAVVSPNVETTGRLRAEGLLPDPDVQPRGYSQSFQLTPTLRIDLTFRVTDSYTNRASTLRSVTGTLLGASLAALVVSLIVGTLAARRLTGPLARLRRASSRFAQGDLDERAPGFAIVEVDELGQQFNVMADRLSDSVRMLEADRDRLREFVADVSHELRTPIAALRTFTELQRDGQLEEDQRHEFLERSTEQINRLEWMSNNLLDLSRIDSGIFPLDMRLGDLRDPVRSAVEAQAEIAEGRGIAVVSRVPTSPVMLRFDRERILQLLGNLIGNALKFTPRGGEVIVELTDAADAAALRVHDSGPGIPEAELPRVFDRFFRGTNVGEARASGSGLGLAIARSIVEMHGGRIEVASVVGSGSTFTITLPRERERS